SAIGTAGGTSDRSRRRSHNGVAEAIKINLKNRNFQVAERICKRNDIEYEHSVVDLRPPQEQGEPNNSVSIMSEYSKSDSEFHHFGKCNIDGSFTSTLTWNLDFNDTRAPFDGAGPRNGVGITFAADRVRPISWDLGDRTKLRKRGSEGVIGGFNDPDLDAGLSPDVPDESKRKGEMSVTYEKLESESCNIYGTYTHSWEVLDQPGSISYGLSAGPISVSASSRIDYWKKRNDITI
ncbi:hypothetical protein, partial [Halorhabdus salina]|uniref:hypothetical protein n=1 Tax=Halorhabdus salina TaxID=2750670 RepID=UPI001C66D9C7